MRIVAGKHRGRFLIAPATREIRPTSDRARQALFNILEHGRFAAAGSPLYGAAVLDGFAGTGALGLEALSRGAARAIFIDQAPAALAAIRANIAALGEADAAQVLRADAIKPPRASQGVGLALLDPPYGADLGPAALTALAASGWFLPDALIILEIGAKDGFAAPPGFVLEDERRIGAARLLFLRA